MKQNRFSLLLLSVLLLVSCICPTLAAAPEERYIVCYREPVQLNADDSNPFTVLSAAELEQALSRDLVAWYEPDYEAELLEDEWDSWSLNLIGAGIAADHSAKGQGIVVGVIDSGVAPHPDLNSNLLQGYNFLTNSSDTTDTYGHGTFVAGIIAAVENNYGVVGVAPMAKIVPLKCFDNNKTSVSTLISAIYAAVDKYHCRILNMSFSLVESSSSLSLQTALDYAASKGTILVSSAGNDGTSELKYPAAFENVIGVGAVDSMKNVWASSQRNNSVFLTAPGVNVRSTSLGSVGYGQGSGTSYAAPQVTGAIAALLSADPTLDAARVRSLLRGGAVDLGPLGYDTSYGYGILNLKNSLDILKSGMIPDKYAYRIQANPAVNGAYTLSARTAPAGTAITIYPLPNEGYVLSQLQVVQKNSTPLTLNAGADNTYSFIMPEGDVTVTATFIPKPPVSFTDVPSKAYYTDAVVWAVQQNLVKGVTETSFAPNQGCTRGQVVTLLWRAAGSPIPRGNAQQFTDVKPGAYYTQAVAWALEAELTNGVTPNHFNPNGLCTREQIVTFLWRYARYLGENPQGTYDLNRFQDASRVSNYALQSIQWACRIGILQGSENKLLPKDTCTRAQIVTLLYRYLA